MESLVSALIAIAILFFGLSLIWKMVMPRGAASKVIAGLILALLEGIWHKIFGPLKVQVVPGKRRGRGRLRR